MNPLILSQISHDYNSSVWSTSKSQAQKLLKPSETEFVMTVNEAIQNSSTTNVTASIMKAAMSTIQPG